MYKIASNLFRTTDSLILLVADRLQDSQNPKNCGAYEARKTEHSYALFKEFPLSLSHPVAPNNELISRISCQTFRANIGTFNTQLSQPN